MTGSLINSYRRHLSSFVWYDIVYWRLAEDASDFEGRVLKHINMPF